MALRVIGGRAHGRSLGVPRGGRTRPTSGLVRGALLNMLEQRGWLADTIVLDLFAGTGALGIEALSRGARGAVFVESAPEAVRTLRANLERTGLAAQAEVLVMPMARALGLLERRRARVDGVLADPPYGGGWAARTLAAVAASGVVPPGGWVGLEHCADEEAEPPEGFALVQSRQHGRTAITLVARREGAA